MAIWQYTFHLLNKEAVDVLNKELSFPLDEDGFDDEPFWKEKATKRNVFFPIEQILPKRSSWSDKIDLYGDQESNCLEVLFEENGHVTSASLRIDFRCSYEIILRRLLEFFIVHGLVILDEELQIVPLNYEQVRSVIEKASQVEKYRKLSKGAGL